MEYKRVLTVQDLSCLGQCSGSIALTTLAAFGYETCLLPTALLSAHTAFRGPYVRQLSDSIGPIAAHWKREGIQFDAILTGYLGAAEDIAPVLGLIDDLLVPGGFCVADPAMADGGKFYSGLNEAYGDAMRALCARADVLLPNRTEAAFLTGLPEGAPATFGGTAPDKRHPDRQHFHPGGNGLCGKRGKNHPGISPEKSSGAILWDRRSVRRRTDGKASERRFPLECGLHGRRFHVGSGQIDI